MSICLWGDTRLGKTLWARSLGRHAYYNTFFSLGECLEDIEYTVFDDIQGGFEYFRSYKAWAGCQRDFWMTDKYKGKVKITGGWPMIWLSNTDPALDRHVDMQWLQGNMIFVHITEPIFRANIE